MGPGLKLPDWRDRLTAYLADCDRVPFSWTDHSCMHFVTGAVTAMTGMDYWWMEREELARMPNRGRVLRYMSNFGGDLKGAATLALARAHAVQKRIPGEGDILMAEVDKAPCLGVCLGRLSAFATKEGVAYIRPPNVMAAWGL